jgi:hypothetical protein
MLAAWLLVALGAATLGVTVAILAVLVRRLRRSRPSPLPRPAAPPLPARRTPVLPPDPSLPSIAAAWGGRYDDAETQPDPLHVPDEVRIAPAVRLHDPDAPTRKYTPLSAEPPPGPATTMTTTVGQIADAIEGDAKRLRESSAGTKVPPAFRAPPFRPTHLKDQPKK